MAFTRNTKKLVGSAIILTASAFMLAAYGTLYRIPLAFLVVYLVALATGGTLAFLGQREEIKSESDRSKFTVNT
jgi:hypothetical protein